MPDILSASFQPMQRPIGVRPVIMIAENRINSLHAGKLDGAAIVGTPVDEIAHRHNAVFFVRGKLIHDGLQLIEAAVHVADDQGATLAGWKLFDEQTRHGGEDEPLQECWKYKFSRQETGANIRHRVG